MNERWPIIAGLLFALVTFLRHNLIIESMVSLLTWCALLLTHPGTIANYWQPALVEYWIAGVVWIGTAVWIVKSLMKAFRRRRSGEHRTVGVLSSVAPPQRWSVLILGLAMYVAIAAPFLTPVNPNAQGNLVTTRLLHPLSIGYVREYFERPDDAKQVPTSQGLFFRANEYLLNRTVSMSGNSEMQDAVVSDTALGAVRRSKMVFLFGTDDNGRDVLSRVIVGARMSLAIGICAALGALLIGVAVGVTAGLHPGMIDALLMRLTDVFLAIPSLFLVIGVLAFVGQSIVTIVVVLSLSGWMGIARVVRGEVVTLREREFILAARLLQVSSWKITTRHLLPNIRSVVLTSTVFQFANAVLGEAALGFLGLGIQPPTATWGNMMGDATAYLGSAWWMGVFPGLVLATVMVAAHSLGNNPADMTISMEHSTGSTG